MGFGIVYGLINAKSAKAKITQLNI